MSGLVAAALYWVVMLVAGGVAWAALVAWTLFVGEKVTSGE